MDNKDDMDATPPKDIFIRILSSQTGWNGVWLNNRLIFSKNSPGYNQKIVDELLKIGPVFLKSIERIMVIRDQWDDLLNDYPNMLEGIEQIDQDIWEDLKRFGGYSLE